jgi:hypothetical protein
MEHESKKGPTPNSLDVGPEMVYAYRIGSTTTCCPNQPLANLPNQPNVVEVHLA